MLFAGHAAHPAANLLPLLRRPELLALANDIEINGLQHPVVLLDGKVLDGRNRLLACGIAKVKPRFVEFEGSSPTAYVLSANLRRRHLTKSQEAMIAAKALPLFEAEARDRLRQSATQRHRQLGHKVRSNLSSARMRSAPGKASEHAAKSLGVGSRYVEAAKQILHEDPKLARQVERGYLTLAGALRVITREKQVAAISSYEMPKGRYPVIVIDPPWRYFEDDDQRREGAPDYPTMSDEEIASLKIPATSDCIVWLWTTNSKMHDAFHVLESWGFEPKSILTWDKVIPRLGFWLRGQTEHCILATKGTPIISVRRPATLIREQSRAHSQKPEAFYNLVEGLCPAGPKLELFARRRRRGWVTSGGELDGADADNVVPLRRGVGS